MLSDRLPGWWLEEATLPSFVEQGVEGQEFFLLLFIFRFLFLRLLLGKDVFLVKAVFPNKFLMGVQLVKMTETAYVHGACAWGGGFAAYLSYQLYQPCRKAF